MLKLLISLRRDDRLFLALTTQAINKKDIANVNRATVIIVNRAFVQSSRQLILATRELLLSETAQTIFEKTLEMDEMLWEQERKDKGLFKK